MSLHRRRHHARNPGKFGAGDLVDRSGKSPAGKLAVAIIRNRKTGEGLRYLVGDQWMPKVVEWLQYLIHPAVIKP